MQTKVILLSLFGLTVAVPQVVAPSNTRCFADNCARALTGTQAGVDRPATRIAQCAAFQTTTLIPGILTTTTTTNTVPSYLASACKSPAAYASACSCAGVAQATTTGPAVGFKIRIKDDSGSLTFAGLGTDTQAFGSTDGPVLTTTTVPGFFRLGPDGSLISNTAGSTAYAYPGSASKFYFSSTGAPNVNGQSYLLYTCAFGAFDAASGGNLLTCTNPTGGCTRGIRQAQGNVGVACDGFDEAAPQGPDVTVTFYAIQ